MDKEDIETLVKEALPIIEAHAKRASDPNYYHRIAIAVVALKQAEDALFAASYSLDELSLDQAHVVGVNDILAAIQSAPSSINEYRSYLTEARDKVGSLRVHLTGATRAEIQNLTNAARIRLFRPIMTRKVEELRSEPRPRYINETLDLMNFWKSRTGKNVTSPKGITDTGEATQDSTEFIRLCLSKIDDTIDTAQTITIIRNARAVEQEVNAILVEFSDPKPRS